MSIYERAGEEGAPQTPREEERVREITLLCVWQSTVQVDAGGANGRGRVDAFIQQLVESGPAAGDELFQAESGRASAASAHLRASVGDGGCGGEEPQLIISVRLYENDF